MLILLGRSQYNAQHDEVVEYPDADFRTVSGFPDIDTHRLLTVLRSSLYISSL